MCLIALLLPKLLTSKDVVTSMHKKTCFRKSLWNQRVNVFQKLVNYAGQHFC